MKMKNKGFGMLILIIAIFVIVSGMGGAYIIKNINKQELRENGNIDSSIIIPDNTQSSKTENMDIIKTKKPATLSTQNDDIVASLDKDTKEVFRGQPGYIKSVIKNGEDQWVLAVDFITQNPKWRLWGTEGFSPDEPFYINQNPKIRNFNTTSKTKFYRCSTREESLVDAETFMESVQMSIENNNDIGYSFNTNGSEVVLIMIVCVP